MSSQPNHPNITLPLLIAYNDALLSSLLADKQKHHSDIASAANTTGTSDDLSKRILWVVEDRHDAEKLNQQLNKQAKPASIKVNSQKTTKNSIENAVKKHTVISTLAALSKQNVRQRYELGCFWLPTLTEEQLQPFIATIMRYRDLYAAHLLIATSDDIDLRAYGFTPFDILDKYNLDSTVEIVKANETCKATMTNPLITLWQFNLYDYKRLPDWLNNNYWANPENWDKHRW